MPKLRAKDRVPGAASRGDRPRRVMRIEGWYEWDEAAGDYVREGAPAPPAPSPPLPPLRPPEGHEAIDPERTYKLVSADLRGSQIHEGTGANLEQLVIDANANWRVLGEKTPVVPMLRVFSSYGEAAGDLIWAGVNDARHLLRDAGAVLLDLEGNIRPHGRWHAQEIAWRAWAIFHERRVKEVTGNG